MKARSFGPFLAGVSGLACVAVLSLAGDARSQTTTTTDGGAFAIQYPHLTSDQAEFISTPDRIMSVASSSGSPMEIWETLEHGESVECLDCVAAVAPLLYAGDAHTREIAAWWLRRRTFGVFGAGEVYSATIATLQSDPSATKRAQAATALGEFLKTTGVAPVATALATDGDEGVRAAAALALGRLNDDGAGALSKAMTDSSTTVKLNALTSSYKINVFTDNASVSTLLGDGDAGVRKRAANVLEALHSTDSVAALITLAQSDPDEQVRIAACHALGALGDASATPALTAISTSDKSTFVKDMATQALLRL
jgi:hypothetical protein